MPDQLRTEVPLPVWEFVTRLGDPVAHYAGPEEAMQDALEATAAFLNVGLTAVLVDPELEQAKKAIWRSEDRIKVGPEMPFPWRWAVVCIGVLFVAALMVALVVYVYSVLPELHP